MQDLLKKHIINLTPGKCEKSLQVRKSKQIFFVLSRPLARSSYFVRLI